jgi:hypothetical protein
MNIAYFVWVRKRLEIVVFFAHYTKTPGFESGCFKNSMVRGREPIGRKMAHRLANALGTSYKNFFW